MSEKPMLTDLLRSVVQVGLVVEDLDAKMAGMRAVFGLEPDSVFEAAFAQTVYRGQIIDTPARIANYDYFGVQIEFIEPKCDKSIWNDFLNDGPHHGHSLHHIKFGDPEDSSIVTELMQDRGIGMYQELQSFVNPGGKSIYYDTLDQLGFFVEITTKR
jgi:hypothetical protein